MNIAEEIERLEGLRRNGTLTEEEFQRAKERVLKDDRPGRWAPLDPDEREHAERQWAFFLHISMLAGFLLPLAGLVVPICIWQIKKEEYPSLDRHGRNALNWILSAILYAIGGAILSIAVIGIPILLAVGVCWIVFPILAAVKANEGRFWPYPLAIRFLSTDEDSRR